MPISKDRIREVFNEELIAYVREKYPEGIDEGIMDSLKSAGKGIMNYYKAMAETMAAQLDQMVQQNLVPPEMQQKAQSEIPTPEDFEKMEPDEQADAMGKVGDVAQAVADEVPDDAKGADEVQDELGDMTGAAEDLEQKVDAAADGKADSGGDQGKMMQDAWKDFQNDKNLRKAMEAFAKGSKEIPPEEMMDVLQQGLVQALAKGLGVKNSSTGLKEAIRRAIKSGAITKRQVKLLAEAIAARKSEKRQRRWKS